MAGAEWIPGASRLAGNGGSMNGPRGVKAVVWHTSESDPRADPVAIARYVTTNRSEYHLVWNPITGKMCQILPATDSARSLRNDGDLQTNRVGDLRIQICVVGRAAEAPLATSPLRGWEAIRAWLDGWGVPEVDVTDPSRSRKTWSRSGHSSHASCPGNDHTDPGRIDWGRLFTPASMPADEEDDMLIIRQGTKSPILIHGSATTVIDNDSAESMEKNGIKACRVTADVYQRFKAL